MNLVVLKGRITKDIEVKYTKTDKAVANFTLAVDKFANGQKGADFINCIVWDKTAENLAKHKGKGDEILVNGKLQVRSYDAPDGSKKYSTEVLVGYVEYCGGAKKQDTADSFGASSEEEIPF